MNEDKDLLNDNDDDDTYVPPLTEEDNDPLIDHLDDKESIHDDDIVDPTL